jgi:hypothetical protein
MDVTDPPILAHGSAGRLDLEKVGNFLFQLSGSGAPIPWSVALLESLFAEAGLPTNFEEATEEPIPAGAETGARPERPRDRAVAAGGSAEVDAAAAAAAGAKPAAAKPAPVKKASRTDTPQGTILNVQTALSRRHAILSAQLEQEINAALSVLGEQAGSAYRGIAHKSSGGGMLNRLVGRVMRSLNLPQWIDQHLKPLLANHAGRVTADTQRTLQAEIGLEFQVADQDAQRIASTAGNGLGMRDIEPQVRAQILDAIQSGLAAGENPLKTANRIRAQVPAGRFVHAGARYRSRLIARDQTASMQRQAAVAAYQSNPHITGVELVDGVYGPPRSDQDCMDRDGETLPIDQASDAQPLHPLCTLGINPIVGGSIDLPDREPELVAA